MADHQIPTKVPTESRFFEVELLERLVRSHVELLERLGEARDFVDVSIAAGIALQELEGVDES